MTSVCRSLRSLASATVPRRGRRGALVALVSMLFACLLIAPSAAGMSTAGDTGADAPPGARASVVVQGTSTYTDRNHKAHPNRGLLVRLREDPIVGGPRVIATTLTRENGFYRFPALDLTWRPLSTFRVEIVAANPGFEVHRLNGGGVWVKASAWQKAPAGTMRVGLHTGKNTDMNGAFAIADALVNGGRYLTSIGRPVDVFHIAWPSTETLYDGSGDTAVIHIGRPNHFDWDTILHEFGHLVADDLELDDPESGGSQHRLEWAIATRLQDKVNGVNSAWQEGFASYFSVAAQEATRSVRLGIPGAGDAEFWEVPLWGEDGPASRGEDNELAIARVLWAFRSGGAASLGDRGLIGALLSAGIQAGDRNFSHYVPALMSAAGGVTFQEFGSATDSDAIETSDRAACLLGSTKIPPSITEVPDEGTSPPQVTWSRGGAPDETPDDGPGNYVFERFTVEVWRQDWSEKLLSVEPPGPAAGDREVSYTFTADEWENVRDAFVDEPVQVSLVVRGSGGMEASQYPTGPYQGCAVDYGEVAPTITAAPVAGTMIRPQPNTVRCRAADWGPDAGAFLLSGENLLPNTIYQLKLHHPTAGVADVALGEIAIGADGNVANTRVPLPKMTSGVGWILVATPPDGPSAQTSILIRPGACVFHYHGPNRVEFDVSGMGALPGSQVSITINGQTQSASVDASGDFGPTVPLVVPCGPGDVTVTVGTVQGLDQEFRFNPAVLPLYCSGRTQREVGIAEPLLVARK